MQEQFAGFVQDGKIKLEKPDIFQKIINGLKNEQKIYLLIRTDSRARSSKQNRYYWGVVLPAIHEHTGQGIDSLHRIFKEMFLPKKEEKFHGKIVQVTGSTTELSTTDFMEYIMQIMGEAGDMGISIPSPDDYI